MMPLHRFRVWILRYLLAEEPYKLAVQFLPALQADMGALCGGWRTKRGLSSCGPRGITCCRSASGGQQQ